MTVTPPLDPDLIATLRRLKLGQLVDTLPERLALAKTNKLSHAEFLRRRPRRRSHPPRHHLRRAPGPRRRASTRP